MRAMSNGWQQWRITTAAPVAPRAAAHPRLTAALPATTERVVDGVRVDLVARLRAEIAAGTYDTDDRWAAAEEALLRRVCG